MALCNRFRRWRKNQQRSAAARKLHKQWWETAAAFPDDELFYDPAEDADPCDAFDPGGSYTGNPVGGGKPEQDADDL
ncbi:MAG: hypothetical protein LBB50_01000 [Oscillospiraceae bacterium]|jgi:hypothetical protein|nr:hypothetical protein [Oscillospiraceae bacterium]